MRTPLLAILLLALPATAQQVYKCRDAAGSVAYQSAPCPDGEIKTFGTPAPRSAPAPDPTEHLRPAWTELCESRHGPAINVIRCVTRHDGDYRHMLAILESPRSTPAQIDRALVCRARWYKDVIGAVDAQMWRVCYYN